MASIQNQDVVYWNAAMKTLWVYSNRVSGSIQALEPSSSAPSSVTVAGRTCGIETSAAAYELSDLGRYSLGDTVTLLLGRDGAVAAVAEGAASASERIGVVTAIENAAYSDGKGGTYTARTVVVLATDGRTYRYENKTGMKEGSLVRVITESQTGAVTLRPITAASLSGKVNTTGTKVGSYSLAQDVEILDVNDAYGIRIYPSRLSGVSLSGDMVKYYSVNSSGEIDRMILNDATGDVYQYGILTDMTVEDAGLSAYYSYEIDLGGVTGTISSSTTRYPVSEGPIRVKGTAQAPEKIYSLISANRGEISGNQFVAGNQKYTLSDHLAVYEVRNGAYYLSSLAQVKDSGFALTGWYDKTDASGGRIRVIVARES